MKKKFVMYTVRPVLMIFLFLLTVWFGAAAAPRAAWGHAKGINGFSGNPATNSGSICTACHYGGTLPTVTLTGPTSLATGSTAVYTFTITGGPAVTGGLDVSTTGGILQATDSTTQLMSSEITQTAATAFSSNTLVFTFTLAAPATAGTVTL